MVQYLKDYNLYVWRGPIPKGRALERVGFIWSPGGEVWYTASPHVAERAGHKIKRVDVDTLTGRILNYGPD